MNELIITSKQDTEVSQVPPAYYPTVVSKQERSRLDRYARYITDVKLSNWTSINIVEYRDYLLAQGLSASSVKAHLSTVRTALARVGRDRDYWYGVASEIAPNASLLERKAIVDEIIVRYADSIAPKVATVKTTTVQDTVDSQFVRLSVQDQRTLLNAPDRNSLAGLRDAAIIGLALATGLRADELCSLKIADIRQTVQGELGVLVREGKGKKQRFVPYGAEKGILALIDQWLARAGITEGDIFRGVNNKGEILAVGIDPNTFNRRLARYMDVNPHDLRRTYAKTRYQQGMDIVSISRNLGHADIKTTMTYIGETDIDKRVPVYGLQYT